VKQLPQSELGLAIALSALAGLIDVAAFLSLGGFFASFMSGNSTRLAIGIGGNWADANLAFSLIIAFVGGVIGGSMLGRGAGPQRQARILLLVAALILACAAIAKPYQATQMLLLAMAMGAMNGVFERNGEVSVGLTYMTGNLVKLGQGLAHWMMREGDIEGWSRHALLWSGFLAGGLIGVGLYWRIALATLYVGGSVALVIALWLWWQNRPVPTAPPEQQGDPQQAGE
jgi:uncharacterized membrane protein YoaK (UPF0700 family)